MKITITITKQELLALAIARFCPKVNPADVILDVQEPDVFTQSDHAMFAEVRQLRSSNLPIAAIKRFRAHTGFGLALSKFACENLDEYIRLSRINKGLLKTFMGYTG